MPQHSRSLRAQIVRRALDLGYTPQVLAAKADISIAQLYRFFNGSSDLSSERVDRLLAVLKLKVSPRTPPPKKRPPAGDTESGETDGG